MATDMPVSLKKGTSAQDRALLFQVVAANLPPTAMSDAMFPAGMNARIEIVGEETNGGTYDVTIWRMYADSGLMIPDAVIGTFSVNANSTWGFPLDIGTASSFYIEVSNFAGGGEASVWAIGRGTLGRFQS